jgi:hypothetical protein
MGERYHDKLFTSANDNDREWKASQKEAFGSLGRRFTPHWNQWRRFISEKSKRVLERINQSGAEARAFALVPRRGFAQFLGSLPCSPERTASEVFDAFTRAGECFSRTKQGSFSALYFIDAAT